MLGGASFRANQEALIVHDGVVTPAEISAAANGTANLLTLLNILPTHFQGTADRDVLEDEVFLEVISPPGITTVRLVEDTSERPVLAPGELTARPLLALLKTLPAAIQFGRTYREWVDSTQLSWPATARVEGQAEDRVMVDRSPMIIARRHLAVGRTADAAETAQRVEAEISRREAKHEPHPEGFLQLGLALEACQRPADALTALRTARNLYEDKSLWRADQHRDPAAREWLRQARYHYGRLQLETGEDLNEAVAALRAALHQDPDDPRVLRTLAQAIRILVERESLVEAAGLLARYANGGAPLGMTEEITQFLNQRRPSR